MDIALVLNDTDQLCIYEAIFQCHNVGHGSMFRHSNSISRHFFKA